MRFNQRGQAAMGVGDGQVSLDNVALCRGGGGPGWWRDADRLVFQSFDGHVSQCVVTTGEVTVQDVRPANVVAAGGGVWAAWANNGLGIFSSTGFAANPARLVDVGPDGAIAYIDERDWTTTRVRERDGSEWTVGGTPLAFRLLGAGRAVWTTPEFMLGARGIDVPVLTRVHAPQILFVGPDAWLLYWLGTDGPVLLCSLKDQDSGYVVTPSGQNAFGFDGVVLGTAIRVGWSRGAGEQPGYYAFREVDLTAPRTNLQAIRQPPAPIVAIGRPLWLGWFEYATPAAAPPGNCALYVHAPMLVSRQPDGAVIAQYVEAEIDGSTPEALARVIVAARASLPTVPVLAYWPWRQQQGDPVPPADAIGIEAYRKTTESIEMFEARLRRVVARCPHAWLIAQCYTSNASNVTDLASLVPIYARIARDCANVEGILVFSDAGRKTGLIDHEEVRPLWAQLAAGITAAPLVQRSASSGMRAPGITIVDPQDEHFRPDGWSCTVRDDANGYETRVFMRNGAIYARAKNAAGEAGTSRRRPVSA